MTLALLLIKCAMGGVMGALLSSMGFTADTWQFWTGLGIFWAYGVSCSIK